MTDLATAVAAPPRARRATLPTRLQDGVLLPRGAVLGGVTPGDHE